MLSLGPPMEEILASVDLLLQLKNSVKQCLSSRRATRHVDINRDYPITTPNDGVRVVIVSTTICAASHGYNPTRFWHLVINPAENRERINITWWLVCESIYRNTMRVQITIFRTSKQTQISQPNTVTKSLVHRVIKEPLEPKWITSKPRHIFCNLNSIYTNTQCIVVISITYVSTLPIIIIILYMSRNGQSFNAHKVRNYPTNDNLCDSLFPSRRVPKDFTPMNPRPSPLWPSSLGLKGNFFMKAPKRYRNSKVKFFFKISLKRINKYRWYFNLLKWLLWFSM